ncbi:two-component sensor histidine kinase [Streptomyces sp. TUS-ST3]|uniref:sensor histidine kinase n=1 Tax=Streptomyces sp. TUS-ST3 TaxID=3025591 RepID=UPI00235B329F|nr:ATP-binding protein [Streptomyces sp. TUS-ST3]GLP63578.1 two-component sensor histidine kinase [Streptomyces sp. TUS-ST3]
MTGTPGYRTGRVRGLIADERRALDDVPPGAVTETARRPHPAPDGRSAPPAARGRTPPATAPDGMPPGPADDHVTQPLPGPGQVQRTRRGRETIRRPSAGARTRSIRTRLYVLVGATLVVVCVAMGVITALFQHAYLMGNLDDRVLDTAERALSRASSHPDGADDPTFLRESAQPAGTLSARLDEKGAVLSAAVVVQDASANASVHDPVHDLGTDQRSALAGLRADGAMHTRAVPGLGTYRVTVLADGGVRVLAGLPMDDVQDTLDALVTIETGVAVAGLAAAGCVCAVVIRRQLRPLGRVAATAAEVSRASLGDGGITGLTRVPARDTDPGSEAGQVGAALNRLLDQVESSLAERQRDEERIRRSEERVRRSEERVRRSEEGMRRSEERMRRFLADASHELRTPLASIAGYAELMNRGTDRVEPVLAWRRVSAESARMTGLVEDLLLLARLDEGRPLDSREVDMAALVAEAVRKARAAAGGHDWQLELSLDAPASVTGDEARLRQVMAALLSNARMHTPAGTTVTASVRSTAERRVIRVRDNGPGIPATLLPTVFERFTRADTSRSRTDAGSGGSGLGLAVAAAITAAHGGRIHVDSVPGRTEFTVDLPAAVEAEAEQRAVSGNGASV